MPLPGAKGTRTVEPATTQRMVTILAMFDDGASFREIGKTVGLSVEGVRRLTLMHREPRQDNTPISPAAMAAALRASLAGNPPPRSRIRRRLARFVPSPLRVPRSKDLYREPQDQWEAAWADRIRRAAVEQGAPLSKLRYDVWADKHGERASQAAAMRGHLWKDLCEMAGVASAGASSAASAARKGRIWTRERCGAALDEFVEAMLRADKRPSQAAYEEWIVGRGYPSWATLRKRLSGLPATEVADRMHALLVDHFAGALARLDAGEDFDPATYVGPFSYVADHDG